MADGPIISNNALRPFDAAKDCLTPRLREDGGLSSARLPESKYFRAAVGVVADQQFAASLSETVSPQVMSKVEKATDWLRGLIQNVSGRTLSFVEPFVVRDLSALGSQQYPLVRINEDLATQIDKTPPAQEAREGSQKFDRAATREAKELDLLATVVHEYVHASRGLQVGRESLNAVRLGLRVNAFNARPTSKRFSAFTEAAAVLTESRFLKEQGLAPDRSWYTSYSDMKQDKTPSMLAWAEMQAIEARKILPSRNQAPITMRDRLLALIKEGGVSVQHNQEKGFQVRLALTKYGNSDALLVTGYQNLQWGMEHLATEIFRGRSTGAQHSVTMFQELLLKSEVLAEPRPVFREILNLAKKDAEQTATLKALDERLLGKRYLNFFACLRPNDPFDLMVFQAFVSADQYLPKERVGQYRSELLHIYKHATADLNLIPNTNAA
jgi:hypothetical protein